MNLTKLFDMQKVLDERIEKEHPRVDGEDRLAKKILALQVELGELANEQRTWKFWSIDREPRINQHVLKKEYQHLHISQTSAYEYQLRDEFGAIVFDDVTDFHHDHKNPLLEEYVDGLHFLLTIGLEIGIDQIDLSFRTEKSHKYGDVVTQFKWLYKTIAEFSIERMKNAYLLSVYEFISLGEMLGFTWEEIEQAYISKNEINHTRQDTGY